MDNILCTEQLLKFWVTVDKHMENDRDVKNASRDLALI